MTNFQNGKIYKIISNNTTNLYIGSTTKNLSARISEHASHYKAWQNGKYHYMRAFELIKEGDYQIVLIENFPCNSKEELRKRERYYIENSENCINKCLPCQTRAECIKRYYINNRESILEKSKMKITCECGAQIRKDKKSVHAKSKKHIKYMNQHQN